MKRIAYAITGLLALALCAVGMSSAHAWTTPSTACDDQYLMEVQVVDDPALPVYLAVETSTDPNGWMSTSICYKDTSGATGIGGHVNVSYQTGDPYVHVYCGGDLPATVALSCYSLVAVDTTDPNPGSLGSGVTGWVKVEGVTGTVPLTGVEAGGPGVTTYDGTSVAPQSTCAWAFGMQVSPSCTGEPAEARLVYEPVPVVTTRGEIVCAGLFAGGDCIGAWVTVPIVDNAYFVGDGGPTLSVTVLGTTVSTPDQHQPGCLGLVRSDDNPECGESQ